MFMNDINMSRSDFVLSPLSSIRVISIKNYHPKIRIITQMLQYHNKVGVMLLLLESLTDVCLCCIVAFYKDIYVWVCTLVCSDVI